MVGYSMIKFTSASEYVQLGLQARYFLLEPLITPHQVRHLRIAALQRLGFFKLARQPLNRLSRPQPDRPLRFPVVLPFAGKLFWSER